MNDLEQCAIQIGKWTKKRNDLIRQAHTEGQSLRTIATVAGLSHTAVAKILAK